MSDTRRFVVVDVFTDVPLAGNQLAVFTDARGLSDAEMQTLAREIGFSETTFVLPAGGDADIRMRIFTVEQELPFAGHPTLGTAFVVGAPLQRTVVRIETGRGVVPVALEREGATIVFGRMEQPLPTMAAYDRTDELLAALGVSGSLLPVELYDNGTPHLYVMLDGDAEVAAVSPDFTRLGALLGPVGVSCFSAEGARVKTRMFAPGLGAFEDAATGSAAGPLAVHLARHGRLEWGQEVIISQGAEIGRPSTLYACAEGGPDSATRVEVGGSAVIVARGEFVV